MFIYFKMIWLFIVNFNQLFVVVLMGNDVEILVDRFRLLFIEWWVGFFIVGVVMWMLVL